MEYIKILNGVKYSKNIFTDFSCGIHEYLWKAVQTDYLRPSVNVSMADLSFVVLEEFHLAQTLCRFRLRLVGTAEILPFFGENFVTFFDFANHGLLLSR